SQPLPDFVLPNMANHNHCWSGFWHFINKISGNRFTAKCSYCKFELPGKPDKLYTHILIFGNWPISKKTNYIKKATSSLLKSQKKALHQENLTSWIVKPLLLEKQAKVDKKLLNAIIYSNLSFKLVKNLYFFEFLNELAPNYCLPSTKILNTKLLYNSYSAYLAKKLEMISSLTDLTINLDG
ncbi:15609_t:CDS:2, partial [Dentiscutata heterogama]